MDSNLEWQSRAPVAGINLELACQFVTHARGDFTSRPTTNAGEAMGQRRRRRPNAAPALDHILAVGSRICRSV